MGDEYEMFESLAAEDADVWARSEVLGMAFCWRVEEKGYWNFFIRKSEMSKWARSLREEREERLAAGACEGSRGGETGG